MRIPCPFCGERDSHEFIYLGDAEKRRPRDGGAEPTEAWVDYVYLRRNPDGRHQELWYHEGGCQSWLVVTRDMRSHAVEGARLAHAAAA